MLYISIFKLHAMNKFNQFLKNFVGARGSKIEQITTINAVTNANDYKDFWEKYKLVVAARNYHYDNFNKWLTYFYVANAAMFVALFKVVNSESAVSLSLLVCIIGSVTGISLFQSSKGYYYWVIHYIKLVNRYEEKMGWVKDDLIYGQMTMEESDLIDYFILSGANVSSSKIAILLGYTFVITWLSLVVHFLNLEWLNEQSIKCHLSLTTLLVLFFYLVLCLLFYLFNSDISHMTISKKSLTEDQKIEDQKKRKSKKRNLVLHSLIMFILLCILINVSILNFVPPSKKINRSHIDSLQHNTINFYPKLIINNTNKEKESPKKKKRTAYFFIKDTIVYKGAIR